MKKHIAIAVLGFIPGLFVYYYLAFSYEFSDYGNLIPECLWGGIAGVFLAFLILFITRQLDILLSWKSFPGIRLLVGILISSILTFVFLWLSSAIHFYIFKPSNPLIYGNTQNEIKLAIIIFILILIYSVIYFALYSYHLYHKVQLENIRLESRRIDLQLRALKSQLSPHFLFNSLNTISLLIYKDVKTAEQFIRKLATSYQYTLNSYSLKWVALEKELKFVRSYQYLLNTRFEDHLTIEIDIPDHLHQTKIPPLTLQMLIENAVKHNASGPDRPLRIEITTEDRWIKVTNNKTTKPDRTQSFKIGLKNIYSRYRLLFDREIEVHDNQMFTVKIPVIV